MNINYFYNFLRCALILLLLCASNLCVGIDDICYAAYELDNRGEKDNALEFGKMCAQREPSMVSLIADKAFERGDKDSALEFDRICVQAAPIMASTIADKWYERGDKDIALEFDKKHAQDFPAFAQKIAEKWYERGDKVEAEEYGNKLLEYWISQSDEDIQKNLGLKLFFAAKIESSYYYQILKNKLIETSKDNISDNYFKFFENIPLNPQFNDVSIIYFLTHRSYINPDFLSGYDISIEEARMMFELDLYELTKKNNITFSILHSIALYAKEDPYFKFHIFYKDDPLHGLCSDRWGAYLSFFKQAYICKHPLRSKNFRGTLVHEWTHQLMDILFNNNSYPYAKDDQTAKSEWDQVMDIIWERVDEEELILYTLLTSDLDYYEQTINSFSGIRSSYDKTDYDSEAVAVFSQMIAKDAYEDPRVKEFLKPINDYWLKYLEPAIEKYIKDRSGKDTFISDWERECFLDHLYRAEIDDESTDFEKEVSGKVNSLPRTPLIKDKGKIVVINGVPQVIWE